MGFTASVNSSWAGEGGGLDPALHEGAWYVMIKKTGFGVRRPEFKS